MQVLSFCTAAGLAMLHVLMEENVSELAGPKGKHDPKCNVNRHGKEATSVTLAGVNTPVKRPWVRAVDGRELEIEAYELAKNQDFFCRVALGRMLHALSSSKNPRDSITAACSRVSGESGLKRLLTTPATISKSAVFSTLASAVTMKLFRPEIGFLK